MVRAHKINSFQGYASRMYLRMQQEVPNMPPLVAANYEATIELAPSYDAGIMTMEELLTAAELKARKVVQNAAVEDEYRRRAAAAAMMQGFAGGYQSAPKTQVNCTSNRIGDYTYTNCH